MSGMLLVHSIVLPVLGAAHLGRLLVIAAHKQLYHLARAVVWDLLAEVRANGGVKVAVGLGLRLVTQEPRSRLLTRLLALDEDRVHSHSLLLGQPDTYGWRLLGSHVRVVTALLRWRVGGSGEEGGGGRGRERGRSITATTMEQREARAVGQVIQALPDPAWHALEAATKETVEKYKQVHYALFLVKCICIRATDDDQRTEQSVPDSNIMARRQRTIGSEKRLRKVTAVHNSSQHRIQNCCDRHCLPQSHHGALSMQL